MVGATVTATNKATNTARTVQTNSSGNYTLPFLTPGLYDIQVDQTGFKGVRREGVQLEVGGTNRVDVAMEVGSVSDVVAVTATAALLTTEGAAVGTVIENRRIVELPLNGRDYLQLIALSPAVTAETPPSFTATGRQGGERANQNYSIAGQRLQFTHYTLDGIENTFYRGRGTAILLTILGIIGAPAAHRVGAHPDAPQTGRRSQWRGQRADTRSGRVGCRSRRRW